MEPKDFAGEIERARTMLQANYRSVTVSASMTAGMPSRSVFISVKTPYWTHEMERREECATDMPLSEWIYREVRFSHAPDIAKAAHSGEGGVMGIDRTLHIYGQRFQHESVEIGGTYDALRELADAIDKALAKGSYTSDHFYVNDDEGYTITITVIHSGELGRLRVPYSDPDCCEGQNSPQLYPSEI